MSSYDLILKKEDKKIVLEYASIEGKRGKPLGIASTEILKNKQTKIVFDDEKNTTLLIPPGKDGYTPQKDVDYFDGKDGVVKFDSLTEEDISSIKSQLKVEDDIKSTMSETKTELEQKIEQSLSSKAEQKELNRLQEELNSKANNEDVESINQTLEEKLQSIDVSSQLKDLATKEDLKGYQAKGDYATKEELKGYQEKGDYASKKELEVLSQKVDKNSVKKVDIWRIAADAVDVERYFSNETNLGEALNGGYKTSLSTNIRSLDDLVSSNMAMKNLASNKEAITYGCSSSKFIHAVAESSTAMKAVAESSTAMKAVIESSTAMKAVIESSTAMKTVAESSTAMKAIKENVKVWTQGLSKKSDSFRPSRVHEIQKVPGEGIYIITKVWDSKTIRDSCTLYSGPNRNIKESYSAENTSTDPKGFVAVHSLWMETTSTYNEMNIKYDLYS